MRSEERRVAFLIGGVQKGGTTALYEYLKRDFPVSLALVKEAHFFDDDSAPWGAPDYNAYHALFDADDGRPRGEVTPIYLYWPNALDRIAAYNPEMRLVFIFRDPVQRAWSHWWMEHQRNFDDAPFSWAIRDGRARVEHDPITPGFHRVYSYVERGFYGAQLQRALKIFPREQILCLRSEDLQKNPLATLNTMASRLGLPQLEGGVQPLQANVGAREAAYSMSEEDAAYLAGLYKDDLQLFSDLSTLNVKDWMTLR
jgi:hypothetical protein